MIQREPVLLQRYNELDNEWLENCWSEPFRRGQFFVSESNVDSVTKGVRIWSRPLFIEKSGNRRVRKKYDSLLLEYIFCF